ncbi:MAG: LacI family transcriptional regulator, partial [Clostridia bacterium]|nr:LacI family transcriptional regulator [Clostridia bacterium]
MANIEEVAKEANVSVATVSRVLNNSSSVREKTRVKVEAAIKKLNYEPNMLGRNLRRSESRMILALLPSITNLFYIEIMDGIKDVANKFGYNVLLCQTDSDAERERTFIDLLKHKLADGLISLDPTLDINTLKEVYMNYPIIQCCEYTEELNIPYVTIDNFLAGYRAVKHLISMGRKNIAMISSCDKFLYARQRKLGYKKALEEAGIEYKEELVINGDLNFEAGQKGMKHLLTLDNKPDGVFVVSDVLAI